MKKIGLVGYGGMGKVHLANYKEIAEAKVVAICDGFIDSSAIPDDIQAYSSMHDMLSKEALDVVDICTPTFSHKDDVITALTAGVNVICEKPLSLSLDDVTEIFTLAEKKGVKVFVAHVLQYSKDAMMLRDMVQSGVYGKVIYGSFLRLSAYPKWAKDGWLFDKKRSGGVPFDLHIHDLDLIVSLFGSPVESTAHSCGVGDDQTNRLYSFTYTYEDKVITSEAAWLGSEVPFNSNFRVCFEKAVVELKDGQLVLYTPERDVEILDNSEDILISTGINVPPTGMFYRELVDFLGQLDDDYVGCARKEEIKTVIDILEKL